MCDYHTAMDYDHFFLEHIMIKAISYSLDFHSAYFRAVHIDGQSWFNFNDVAFFLGLHPDASEGVLLRLQADEVVERKIASIHGPRMATYISESGLHKLTERSNKPEAKAFQEWVTNVVLPGRRKGIPSQDRKDLLGQSKQVTSV